MFLFKSCSACAEGTNVSCSAMCPVMTSLNPWGRAQRDFRNLCQAGEAQMWGAAAPRGWEQELGSRSRARQALQGSAEGRVAGDCRALSDTSTQQP